MLQTAPALAAQLSHLRILQIRFKLVSLSTLHLPVFSGSTFRGLLGHSLRRVACSCGTANFCARRPDCVYHFLFETTSPGGGEEVFRPFVLDPPPPDARLIPSDTPFYLAFTLFGPAIEALPYFISCAEEMGRQGLGERRDRFRLIRAEERTKGLWVPFYENGKFSHEPAARSLGESASRGSGLDDVSGLEMTFLSPTRLVHQGRLVTVPDLHVVVRAALRRLDGLLQMYAGHALEVDYRGLVAQAAGCSVERDSTCWFDWERVSARQNRSMRLGGLVGSCTWSGPIGAFLPLLAAASVTHIGKNTTFGLGRFQLRVPV